MGVDGFRLDAIPYLVEREGTSNENLPETHEVIKKLRAAIDARYKNRFLLAEANMWPEDVREYFGDGDECHMAYHFPLMPRMYMAIAQEDRHPVVEIMQQTPEIPDSCQWAIFLRNHDELTLEMVTSKERDYMYHMYAADPRARINLGIRRRLAPLMENDLDRIKLMNSLLLSMPGSPIIYYGDEIGMGDNIFLGDRNGVRTPMQWSPDRNAGFSRADPQRLYLPPIMDPIYGYEAVNVEAQARDAELAAQLDEAHARRAQDQPRLRPRQAQLPAARQPQDPRLPARVRRRRDPVRGQPVALGAAGRARPVALQGPRAGRAARAHAVPADRRAALPADPARLRLLLVPARRRRRRCRAGTRKASPREDLPVLVLFDGWTSFFRDRVVPWRIGMAEQMRAQFETEMLPRFLEIAALVRGQGPTDRARARWSTTRCGSAGGAAGCWRCSKLEGPAERGDLLRAARAGVGRARRGAHARAWRRPRSRRCGSRRTSACWAMRSATRRSAARSSQRDRRRAASSPTRGRPAALHGRPPRSASSPATLAATAGDAARAR